MPFTQELYYNETRGYGLIKIITSITVRIMYENVNVTIVISKLTVGNLLLFANCLTTGYSL